MDPLSVTASIIAVLQLTSSVIGYLNTVKNASADQSRMLIEASSLYGLLTTLQTRVESTLPDDSWLVQVKRLSDKNGPLDQFKSTLESIAVSVQPVTGAAKALKVLRWKFDKNKIEEALTKLERLKTLIGLALQNDLLSLSQAIHGDLGSIGMAVSNIAIGISQLQLNQTNEIQTKISRWLDVPDPSSNHNDACRKRQPTTGSWFLESDKFASWKTDQGSFLWLHGIPGCGKTILCSTIIQEVIRCCHEDANSSIAYFYFDFNDTAKRRHDKLVRSLVVQLAMQNLDGLKKLERLHSNCQDGHKQPIDDDLVVLLTELIADRNHVYIILDALDECQSRDELMGLIQAIKDRKSESLHLLVTSRKEKDIEDTLEPLVTGDISIQSILVNADIHIHIRDRLQHDPKLSKWPSPVQAEIEQALMKGAHGMFRWIVCQLESIRKCIRLDSLRKALSTLPKTLNETYTRILLEIEEEYRNDAQRVLQWLCFSACPLRLNEIVEVLAIHLDHNPGFYPEERLPDARDVVTICSSLVSIVTSRSEDGDNYDMGTEVRLAHFSVKEYLLSDYVPVRIVSYFNLDAGLAHASIAQACLLYTLYLCSLRPLTQPILDNYHLARYAAEHWTYHMTIDKRNDLSEGLNYLALQLLDSKSGNLATWLQLFDPDWPWMKINLKKSMNEAASSLYYSSQAGLVKVAEVLISEGANVNAQGGRFGNALQAASHGGHERIVELLLSQGADVNTQGGHFGNALQAASVGGHERIVELLLSKGADVNTQGGLFGNALQAASDRGHEQIVELLLSQGADVNAQGGHYGNALQAALFRGHEKIVELLLSQGADVNAQGGYYSNTLQAASHGGHEKIVELLLSQGADVNAQGGLYGNALQAASDRGHEQIVELLLSQGADVNAQGGHYGNALQAASDRGHEQIVELLLSQGADVNAQGGHFGNALQAASFRGHERIVELLLSQGADVNTQGGYYGNALQAASHGGHERIVELLLSQGADINAQEGDYGNALQAASDGGHERIVELLLSQGADVDAQGGHRSL